MVDSQDLLLHHLCLFRPVESNKKWHLNSRKSKLQEDWLKFQQLSALYLLSTLSLRTLKEMGKIKCRDLTVGRRQQQKKRKSLKGSLGHQSWVWIFNTVGKKITHLRALNSTPVRTWTSLNKDRNNKKRLESIFVFYPPLLLWFTFMLFPLKSCKIAELFVTAWSTRYVVSAARGLSLKTRAKDVVWRFR